MRFRAALLLLERRRIESNEKRAGRKINGATRNAPPIKTQLTFLLPFLPSFLPFSLFLSFHCAEIFPP